MRITLIRHLPTEWNRKTWLQGRRDIGLAPLREEDRQRIAVNRRQLEKLAPFDAVLASMLTRTRQTARLYGYEADTESLLDELDFGPFEGQPKAALLEKYGSEWVETPKKLTLGESMQDFEKRIRTFLDKYRKQTNLLVFGHGSWIRAFLSYLDYGHINEMNKVTVENNCCLTRFFHLNHLKRRIEDCQKY